MNKVYVALGCFVALLLTGVSPSYSADVRIKNYIANAELKGSSVTVQCKIEPVSKDPVKKLHFEARKAGNEKITNVSLSANGTAVPVKITTKEHDWAGKHVFFYIIDQELPTPIKKGEKLTLSYVVNDVEPAKYLQVPLFIPSWKLLQDETAFHAYLKLPSGSYFQEKSLPIAYDTKESNGTETVLFKNLNLPTGIYAAIGPVKAGFFNWANNWTIFMFVLIAVISFVYLRYEINQRKGGAGR